MNYNNSTEAYMRTVAKLGRRQSLRVWDYLDLPGWLQLWKPVGKILLVIFPLVLIINILVAGAVSNVEQSIVAVGNHRHELMDKNIELLAQRAYLYSPTSIEQLAGEKLDLHKSTKDQVGVFNRRFGTFINPE